MRFVVGRGVRLLVIQMVCRAPTVRSALSGEILVASEQEASTDQPPDAVVSELGAGRD